MLTRWSACFLTALSILWATCAVAGDMDRYKRFAATDSGEWECDEDDQGSQQVSCRYTEVGVISGVVGLFSVKTQEDPRWPQLEKYWDSAPNNYLKFTAVACARAKLKEQAENEARGRAKARVEQQIEKYESTWFTGRLKAVGYRQNDWGYKCVATPNTTDKSKRMAAKSPDSTFEPPAPKPYVAPTPTKRNVATFTIHNNDRYKIGLSFFSQTRRNWQWPGGNQQYNLSGSYTYELNCRPGEKICYGAWRDYQTYYWGVGHGENGCQGCCTTCGSSLEVSLTDAGPDSYASNSSSGPSAADVINLFTGVMQGIQNIPSYREPTYSQPTYRPRKSPRGSDITGTNR